VKILPALFFFKTRITQIKTNYGWDKPRIRLRRAYGVTGCADKTDEGRGAHAARVWVSALAS